MFTMAKKTVKKRNPQDVTIRNIQAANKKIKALAVAVAQLQLNEQYIAGEIAALKRQAAQR